MRINVPAFSRLVRIAFAIAIAVFSSAPLFAQIALSNPPTNPPVWSSDPTVTSTDDWTNWKRNCSDMVHNFGKESVLNCGTSTFRSRPFHFVAQSVVPGSGVGGGGYYGRDLNSDIWQNRLELTGVMTIRQFWFAEAKFTARRPHFGSFHSDENFAFQIYARNKQMQALPFYGLGPDTNVHNAVQFSERDTRAGALVASPLTSWLSASATFETLWPNIGNVDSTKII